MKDQKNAMQLMENSMKLAIGLLKSLKEYNTQYPSTKVTLQKEAEDSVQTAAVLIACEILKTDSIEKAENYVNELLG